MTLDQTAKALLEETREEVKALDAREDARQFESLRRHNEMMAQLSAIRADCAALAGRMDRMEPVMERTERVFAGAEGVRYIMMFLAAIAAFGAAIAAILAFFKVGRP